MKTTFTYYILNYIHSDLLGEKLNVGILFYFHKDRKLVFKYPESFKRIREVYQDFPEWQLKSSLRAIDNKVDDLNYDLNNLFPPKVSIDELQYLILNLDATVLRFTEGKTCISESLNDTAVNKYYALFFSNYRVRSKRIRHDEDYLIRRFKNELTSKNSSIANLLRKDVVLKSSRTSIKFDYQWQNGSPNLVKPISFDLEEDGSINNKAILFYGQLNFLAEEIRNKKYNIDILVSAPSNDASDKLCAAYYKALDILKETPIERKTIVEEKNLDNYVSKVLNTIHASPESE